MYAKTPFARFTPNNLIILFSKVSEGDIVAAYRYEVLTGDGTPERTDVIHTGIIHEYPRTDGWTHLVERLLQSVELGPPAS